MLTPRCLRGLSRWGRAQEVPGEDPYLTGEYGSYIISATQQPGDDPRYLAAASTMKHFSLYDFEGIAPWGVDQYPRNSSNEYATPNSSSCDGVTSSPTDGHGWHHCSRMTFDAFPPAQDFASYYMKAFEVVAQRGQPEAIMCSYNAVGGILPGSTYMCMPPYIHTRGRVAAWPQQLVCFEVGQGAMLSIMHVVLDGVGGEHRECATAKQMVTVRLSHHLSQHGLQLGIPAFLGQILLVDVQLVRVL
eukprot:SAG25_NODE_554_length_6983_cov_2.661970_6_plen_246_part_00